MLILNERKYTEELYSGKNTEVKSVVQKVAYITRYNLFALDKNDSDNYFCTVEWMKKNHENFDESCYSKLIADSVKKAHKKPFFDIGHIIITKNELEIISSLNNLRAEKVLFVLLCMAKQQSVVMGFTNGLVKYSLPDLCKTARISVPTGEREYILYNIIQSGYLDYPKKNNSSCLMVNFIEDDGETGLVLDEVDCKELAYAYLNWKSGGRGYARCEFCGRLMKVNKKITQRYCKGCMEIVGDVPDDMKVVQCVDCGKIIYTSIFDSAKCRCDECYAIYRRIKKTETMRKLREKS